MSIKGFLVKGQVQKYDYQELENLPPEKIFWAIYNTTTFTNIETASNAGKIVMLKLPSQFNNVIIPLSCFVTEEGVKYAKFYGISGDTKDTSYVYTAQCDEQMNFWVINKTPISELAPIQRVNNKTGDVVLNASDVGALPASTTIPNKTSDLLNDEGFIDTSRAAAAAPVQSVNGQTGNVTVPTLPAGGTTSQVLAKKTNTDYDAEWADPSQFTDEIEAELAALDPDIHSEAYTWTLGRNYNSSGSLGTQNGFAITQYLPVTPGTLFVNRSVPVDGAGKNTQVFIHQFSGSTWLRRKGLANEPHYVAIDDDADRVRIAFGYPSDQGVTITQEMIDENFAIRIIKKMPEEASDVGAVATNQGSANAGKILVVGNNGYITMVTREQWLEGNY